MPSLIEFLNTIFHPEAATCFTAKPHGTDVRPPLEGDLFFCINELDSSRDAEPTQDWHHPDRPRRADCNVTSYRNFLIELDNMPLYDQVAYVKSRVPVTSIVFSGGKSYHFIISLEVPLSSKAEYDSIARRLLKLLPAADKSCKNPSRLSRLPFATRPDTGLKQDLVYLGSRIENKRLLDLLPEENMRITQTRSPDEVRLLTTPIIMEAADSPNQVMAKMGMDSRNRFFFWLHNRFKDAGIGAEAQWYYTEKAYNNLQDKEDFGWDEAQAAARLK